MNQTKKNNQMMIQKEYFSEIFCALFTILLQQLINANCDLNSLINSVNPISQLHKKNHNIPQHIYIHKSFKYNQKNCVKYLNFICNLMDILSIIKLYPTFNN